MNVFRAALEQSQQTYSDNFDVSFADCNMERSLSIGFFFRNVCPISEQQLSKHKEVLGTAIFLQTLASTISA